MYFSEYKYVEDFKDVVFLRSYSLGQNAHLIYKDFKDFKDVGLSQVGLASLLVVGYSEFGKEHTPWISG